MQVPSFEEFLVDYVVEIYQSKQKSSMPRQETMDLMIEFIKNCRNYPNNELAKFFANKNTDNTAKENVLKFFLKPKLAEEARKLKTSAEKVSYGKTIINEYMQEKPKITFEELLFDYAAKVYRGGNPDRLMQEFIEKCRLYKYKNSLAQFFAYGKDYDIKKDIFAYFSKPIHIGEAASLKKSEDKIRHSKELIQHFREHMSFYYKKNPQVSVMINKL